MTGKSRSLILLIYLLQSGFLAQAQAQVPSATGPVPEPEASASPATEAVATPARQRRLPKVRPDYMRSKYTMDRSEIEADHRTLVLATGVDKIIDVEASINMSDKPPMVGNTTIVAVMTVAPKGPGSERQLIFKPLAEGETNVTIRDKDDNVRIIFDVMVAKQNQVRYYDRLKENLKEVEGISITLDDKNIVLRGEVLTVNDYNTIYNEISDKAYGDYVVNKVTMSPVTFGILAKKIEQDLQAVVAPTLKAEVINGKIVLGGTVEEDGLKARAYSRAFWYLPALRLKEPIAGAPNVESAEQDKRFFILQNDINVVPPPKKRESKLVRVTVYFVELTKDFLKGFGFKWAPGFSADPTITIGNTAAGDVAAGGQSGFSFSAILTQLFPSFSAPPSSMSYGRIMKSGTIVVKSGEKGKIEDTIAIPTQTLGSNGTLASGPATQGASFIIEMTPTILQGQDVDISFSGNQSSPVGKGVGGQPITFTHKIDSRVYLKSGEVAAIASVNNQTVSTTFNRDDPNSGSYQTGQGQTQTRQLFNLMRSKSMSKARGQYVFFVSPMIVDSASEGTEDLKKNFRMTSGSR